ncbi:hypothetical protein CC78DRAFT_540573 [Lojkania enalia]|uniref:Uncharacterized protein n=1 Tax=Lojkania enalia TaxID=147567 RepID=A0A9P4KHC5_9PLEO|nr:hypothetical protein CC78DRAFT_540573 [Didymosphaeria enalia]
MTEISSPTPSDVSGDGSSRHSVDSGDNGMDIIAQFLDVDGDEEMLHYLNPEDRTDTCLVEQTHHTQLSQDQAAGMPAQVHQLQVSPLAFVNDQHGARQYRRRTTMLPQIHPQSDATIPEVKRRREMIVKVMVQAVWNLRGVHDKPDSRETKMFTFGGTDAADPQHVEAACRSVFDFLLDRVEIGFRGGHKDNKAIRPAKDVEVDRDGNCLTRIRNVIRAIQLSKCTCRDILYEDYKVMLLVNHPLSYLKTKHTVRKNNVVKAMAIQKAQELQERDETRYGGSSNNLSRKLKEKQLQEELEVVQKQRWQTFADLYPKAQNGTVSESSTKMAESECESATVQTSTQNIPATAQRGYGTPLVPSPPVQFSQGNIGEGWFDPIPLDMRKTDGDSAPYPFMPTHLWQCGYLTNVVRDQFAVTNGLVQAVPGSGSYINPDIGEPSRAQVPYPNLTNQAIDSTQSGAYRANKRSITELEDVDEDEHVKPVTTTPQPKRTKKTPEEPHDKIGLEDENETLLSYIE